MEENNLRTLYRRALILIIADAEKHINELETALVEPKNIPNGLIDMLTNALALLKEQLEGYNGELLRVDLISVNAMRIFLDNVKEKYGKEPQFSFLKDTEI